MIIDLHNLISTLNMEKNGFFYIVLLSLTYLGISYGYLTYYNIDICDVSHCMTILPLVILNVFSVLSYIVYAKHIDDEEKANKLGGHMILIPIYLLTFYICFTIINGLR
jgi:phage shock protein PspC (stress-responsive transcriptional regulator)